MTDVITDPAAQPTGAPDVISEPQGTTPSIETQGPVPTTPVKEQPTTHVIMPGDTLASIAEEYGIDEATLIHYNQGELDRHAISRGLLQGSESGRILFSGHVVNLEPVANGGAAGGTVAPVVSNAGELARFYQLYQAGVINDAEFAQAKARLL